MNGSDLSESSSERSELFSERRCQGGRIMSSVAIAQGLTRDIAGIIAPNGNWKDQISAVYEGLTNKEFSHRLKDLTWNRVKSWFYGEARRADYHEVLALQELRAIQEARRAKLKLAATANILAAHLAAEGAPLDGHQMRALGRLAGALDLSGTGGDAR
ncbi:hypothetical protein [Aminobacter carboxidus]|uniref:Uncharacterized protein n=1 Tax=Aminobacter carboxidus TaxID=376165 RepID=A0ABR9GWS8_9HYPH|nr:hypothetical protein [Aminobacter carboxidus]MBE1208145.1 hypothetical protein [Aminobacter carboxidus]